MFNAYLNGSHKFAALLFKYFKEGVREGGHIKRFGKTQTKLPPSPPPLSERGLGTIDKGSSEFKGTIRNVRSMIAITEPSRVALGA